MLKRILLVLLVLILALPLIVWFGAPVIANHQLKKYIAKADTASFSYLELDLWEGNLVVHDIYLHDTTGGISKQPVLVSLNRVALKGLDLWKVYKENRIDIDSLSLGKGKLILPLYKSTNPEDTVTDTTSTNELNIPFLSLTLHHIAIDSLDFALTLNPNELNERYSGILSFSADSISVPFKKAENLYYQKAAFKLRNIYAQPKNSIAYYMADSINLISENHSLSVFGFKLRQRIKALKYARHFGFDKVYVKMDVNHVLIKGLPKRLRSLADGVHVSHVQITDAQAYLYKNSRLPHNMKEKKFIVEALYELNFPVRVDTVDISNGQLIFSQNWRADYVPGIFRLGITKAKMLNFTNHEPDSRYGKWTTISADLRIYEKLQLLVDWKFDLAQKGTAFTLDVTFGQTALSRLNPFTENTVGLRFKDGYLDGGRLLVEANKQSGAGSLELYYHDMKVEFLSREDHHKNVVQWAGGGLTNLIVRNNNIATKKPRLGIVYAEPVADKVIFSFVSKMIFSGFQDIALTSSNESLVAKRGMTYLPMPKAAQESADKAAAKQEKRDKKAERKADRKARKAERQSN